MIHRSDWRDLVASDFSLPFDTRPLPESDLLKEDRDLLERVEQALLAIAEDADTPAGSRPASDRAQKSPWARPDPSRTPRVMMIDGERGTGKTSLLLTLLDTWQEGRTEPRPWAKPEVAARVRALQPLDFDPLPPGLPLLAWIVQAFRPVVDWLLVRTPELGPRGLSRLSETAAGRPESLLSVWQRLHDDAAVAWQPPDALEPFEDGVEQLRRVGKWGGFLDEWTRFLDLLMAQLTATRAWSSGSTGILVLPIDDVDMQIARAPELMRALRILHHPRLVFLLTGHGDLLEHVLQLDFDGQRARLAQPRHLGGDRTLEAAADLGKKAAAKVVREPLRFRLRLLDLPAALDWRGGELVKAAGEDSGANVLKEYVAKKPESWTGLLSITYRQLTDVAVEIGHAKPEERLATLLRGLVRYASPETWSHKADGALAQIAEKGGLEGIARAIAAGDPNGRLVLELVPKVWHDLLGRRGRGDLPRVRLAISPQLARPDSDSPRPLDRWLELWALHRGEASERAGAYVWEGGWRNGAVIRTVPPSQRADPSTDGYPWPSPWFATWAGAPDVRMLLAEAEHRKLWKSLIEEGVLAEKAQVRADNDGDLEWEAILTAWVLFHQRDAGRPAGRADGKGTRLRAAVKRPLDDYRQAGPGGEPVDARAAVLALAHPGYAIAESLAVVLIEALWPLLAGPQEARSAWSDADWEQAWRVSPRAPEYLEDALECLHWVGLLNEQHVQDLKDGWLDDMDVALLASTPARDLRRRTVTETPWGCRVVQHVVGPGGWATLALSNSRLTGSVAVFSPTFLSKSQETRYVSIIMLAVDTNERWLGPSMWRRPGFAAEAVGRLAILQGWFVELAAFALKGVSGRWTASNWVSEIWALMRKKGDLHVMFSGIADEDVRPNFRVRGRPILADPSGLLSVQPSAMIEARLVDHAGPQGAGRVAIHRDKRWAFRGDGLPDHPAERDAHCAWLCLAADISLEQGGQVKGVEIITDASPWIEVEGEPWPAPPLRSFHELDRLRLRMSEERHPDGIRAQSFEYELWWVTQYLQWVFDLSVDPWTISRLDPLEADLDRIWSAGGQRLKVFSTFAANPPAGPARDRLVALAHWWLAIRPSLGKLLGDRLSERLQPVDAQASALIPKPAPAATQGS